MNKNFTVFDQDTGAVCSNFSVGGASEALLNVDSHQVLVEGEFPADQFRLLNGVVTEIPPPPGPWAVFDTTTEQWVDPRTPADLEAELQARRDAAWLTKPDFLLACMGAGILTPAEAATAAQGIVPEPFQSAVDALDPMTQAYLAVIWPTATIIERMDPFIQTIAAVRGFPDALIDQLFGIETSWPSPSNIL